MNLGMEETLENRRIDEKEAKKIAAVVCREADLPLPKIVLERRKLGWSLRRGTMYRQVFGRCWREGKLIELFEDGDTVHTLIHELSHLRVSGHPQKFYDEMSRLMSILEENQQKVWEPKPGEVTDDEEELIEYVLELVEDAVVNNKISIAAIGRILVTEGCSNNSFLSKVVSRVVDAGIVVEKGRSN